METSGLAGVPGAGSQQGQLRAGEGKRTSSVCEKWDPASVCHTQVDGAAQATSVFVYAESSGYPRRPAPCLGLQARLSPDLSHDIFIFSKINFILE